MSDYKEGTHRLKTSRKVFTCDECKQEIGKRSFYIRLSIFHLGKYTSVARHTECDLIQTAMTDHFMTSEGFPMTLLAGFKSRPELWLKMRARMEEKYKPAYDRLVQAGLSPE